MTAELLPNGLPAIKRFITDHDNDGKAVFNNTVNEPLEWQAIGEMANFSLGYTTSSFPVKLEDGKDLKGKDGYLDYLENKPGITIPGGTVLRIVDMSPGTTSPMHRTISLDYGVVLEGEVELILDSGEKRLMKRGDVSVQRSTNHAWRNTSDVEWVRMLYVLQESEPFTVNGETLVEDYGTGMPGVRFSS
jgi:quercetin dioxygenase-like cupin family protein